MPAAKSKAKDRPAIPDTSEEVRHVAYWLLVVGGGLVLNLLVLVGMAGTD